jgi:glycosyltransferase involved in cell wall biosynthesis
VTLEKEDVEVLLGIFNGGAFLEEFLNSLTNQIGVNVHLIVSDDNSTDNSLEIVKRYENRFASMKTFHGPQKGPAENYFFLLRHSTCNYVALADQDDVWMPDHLIKSIDRLIKSGQKPSLSFSSVREFSQNKYMNGRQWPKHIHLDSKYALFTENQARGCTFVMNRAAVDLVNQHHPNFAVMHDWWIALLLRLVGTISFSQDPEIYYRIHPNNHVGNAPSFKNRLKRYQESREAGESWLPLNQLIEITMHYGDIMHKDTLITLNNFTQIAQSKKIKTRSRVAFLPQRLRLKLIDEIFLRVLLVVGSKRSPLTSKWVVTRLKNLIGRTRKYFLTDIPAKVSSFILIRLLRKDRFFELVRLQESLKISKKIAVLAIFPRSALISSSIRLCNFLMKNGYQVVLVVNGNIQEGWLKSFDSIPVSILSRNNVGRDFGAYKAGIEFLQKIQAFQSVEYLLLANDSVLYLNSMENFLEEFDNDSGDWVTAFLNLEKHAHAQSFFQKFSSSILKSEDFISFWDCYYPSNHREHAIDRGEVALSKTLINAGFFPSSTVSSERILTLLQAQNLNADESSALFKGILDTKSFLEFNPGQKLVESRIREVFLTSNCSHVTGLLASRLMGAPLKIDIYRAGYASISAIERLFISERLNTQEAEELGKLITSSRRERSDRNGVGV